MLALTAMLAASLILTGCQKSETASVGDAYPSGAVTMTAGANPGSGFDLTIRSVVEALQKEHLVAHFKHRVRPGDEAQVRRRA